ncbi:hypothetical protein IGS73_12790 [Janibacter indicus]|uniref:Uncharacterized protein n=1 Tax=Janibacter indicus TaxID=857417 RepID=A0A1L3MI95_9MICO|nr:hypothetical protein [Janibacter indicus]APH02042.1 hypothetical protein ASJ30_11345 [Janibacter indicus]QOK21978.1 hypothetical protein IGS73_12790 [Janibacter indicus]
MTGPGPTQQLVLDAMSQDGEVDARWESGRLVFTGPGEDRATWTVSDHDLARAWVDSRRGSRAAYGRKVAGGFVLESIYTTLALRRDVGLPGTWDFTG